MMPVAAPIILSALGTGVAAKGTRDARKGQKEQLAQSERLAAESAANQAQGERTAADIFTRRRSRRTPGFSDAGAASSGIGASAGTSGAYLGQ
jgi:hypothetical protein